MKTDIYTKVILTVIAVCLLILALENGNIVTENARDTSGYMLVPTNPDGSVNVRIHSAPDHQNVIIVGWKDRAGYGDDSFNINDLKDHPLPVK